jgi:hypothetical protein
MQVIGLSAQSLAQCGKTRAAASPEILTKAEVLIPKCKHL